MMNRRFSVQIAVGLVLCLPGVSTLAERKYGPGVTDTEIKLGQTMPYSGPASAFATIGRAEQAYFDKINADGGVNGRRLRLISLDDAFNPAKTVEQTRKLVEGEEVLALFNSLGPGQLAIRKYVNQNKVPFLFVGAGGKEWYDPEQSPWDMGFMPSFESEGRAFGHYIATNYPKAKVAVLGDNRELGRDGLQGLKEALKGRSAEIVAVATHEIEAPTVDSQIVTLQASGADVFVNWSSPKTAAQVIRKLNDIGWRPVHLLSYVSSSVEAVLVPAGLDKSLGIVTTGYLKHPSDPTWKDDPGMKEFFAWMRQFYSAGNLDEYNAYAYTLAQAMVHVVRKCGDDLTRDNLMLQATSIRDLELPLLLPGIKVNTSPTNYRPVKPLQMLRFDGRQWVPIGKLFEP